MTAFTLTYGFPERNTPNKTFNDKIESQVKPTLNSNGFPFISFETKSKCKEKCQTFSLN